jgi:HK97 family phage major capsid protein
MDKVNELREEARAGLTTAADFLKEGEVDSFKKAKADAIEKIEKADVIEQELGSLEVLTGEFNKPTNSVPLSYEEAKLYNRDDEGKDYRNDYKPANWVKGLPAAVQPTWVRDQMGGNLKEEETFYKDTWTKWFRDRSPNAQKFWQLADSDELKAMQEGTDNEGGYFVPEDFRTQVIHNTGVPGGVHRPACTVITTSLKDGYLPTMGSVSWAAIAEEAAYGDNTPSAGQVTFTIRKAGGTVKVSNELLEDSAVNLPALLSQIFGEAQGRYEDQQLIEGDGSSEAEGLRTTATDGTDTDSTSAVSIADIQTWYFDLPAQFRANASVSTTSSFMQQVNTLDVTSSKGSLTSAPAEALLGRPTLLFDGTGWDDAAAIATNEEVGAIGDFSNYYLIDRIGMSMRRDDSIYVANDQVGFFARSRYDGRVGLADAFRIFKIQ